MIYIKRLDEPDVLQKNKEKWTARFLEKRKKSPECRPESRQYRHKEIYDTLGTMSHHKCFYCEQSLKSTKDEVDHYHEVIDHPERAYDWTNLYLACCDCNKKLPNKSIPVSDCLDPCDPEVRPNEHLAFVNECIRMRNGSVIGQKTIQKYKLNRDDLDYKRVKQLQLFERVLDGIRLRQIADKRDGLSGKEIELLNRFRQPDQPFSLMFSCYLEQLDLGEIAP